ncbi:hypothetical protein LCGC14_1018550 [marine sediment metagenome]|uniref:Uncharacterized protein n=1 Tax=marine sediment metagenome TaxID=412755 RepID=A0A0F9R451_9ZZZZ
MLKRIEVYGLGMAYEVQCTFCGKSFGAEKLHGDRWEAALNAGEAGWETQIGKGGYHVILCPECLEKDQKEINALRENERLDSIGEDPIVEPIMD